MHTSLIIIMVATHIIANSLTINFCMKVTIPSIIILSLKVTSPSLRLTHFLWNYDIVRAEQVDYNDRSICISTKSNLFQHQSPPALQFRFALNISRACIGTCKAASGGRVHETSAHTNHCVPTCLPSSINNRDTCMHVGIYYLHSWTWTPD